MPNWSEILKVAVPAGAAVGTGVIASRASNSAAKTQAQSANDALALQRDIFNREQQNLAPYLGAGQLGLQELLRGLGIRSGAANPAGGPAAGSSSYSSPLLGNLSAQKPGGHALGTIANDATTGAAIGSFVPGVGTAIGAGVGAAVGGVSSLYGRGRKQADHLVPLQNQVSGEVDRITKAVNEAKANGTLTQADLQTAINTVQGLQQEFGSVAQGFDRAGQGGIDTLAKSFNPLVQGWQSEVGSLAPSPSGDQTGQSSADEGIGFGDLNREFDYTKDPRYNPQFDALNHPFTEADFQKDPGDDFRMAEGQKGIERSGSAKGMTLSGAGLKAIERFRQDYASNEFQRAYDRFTGERANATGEYQRAFDRFNTQQTNQFNKLATVAGIGQTANSQNNSAGAYFGANASDLITDAGSAAAQNQVNQAGIYGGLVNQAGTTLRDILNTRKSGYSAPGGRPSYSIPDLESD